MTFVPFFAHYKTLSHLLRIIWKIHELIMENKLCKCCKVTVVYLSSYSRHVKQAKVYSLWTGKDSEVSHVQVTCPSSHSWSVTAILIDILIQVILLGRCAHVYITEMLIYILWSFIFFSLFFSPFVIPIIRGIEDTFLRLGKNGGL